MQKQSTGRLLPLDRAPRLVISFFGPWIAWNGGMEKKMEAILMWLKGDCKRIHSFIPS